MPEEGGVADEAALWLAHSTQPMLAPFEWWDPDTGWHPVTPASGIPTRAGQATHTRIDPDAGRRMLGQVIVLAMDPRREALLLHGTAGVALEEALDFYTAVRKVLGLA
jgi:hypothetical protein